ncbi:PREDICTED: pollen receptor-like kinase 3 [Lupinus angustifolius]|uniref:pollen receptor-like kinase 3 n=1 Tax=Lupinus angustifolius TaxID=3871 RepID=UPI00092EE29A|nr:PREDICTED: pollen receptor-like kinase 3 [Lupinus angustifolius]
MALAGVISLQPNLLFNIIIIMFFNIFQMTYSMSEDEALLSLKKSFSNAQALDTWVAGTSPCTEDDQWVGVACSNGQVTRIRLGDMGLQGKIDADALHQLKALRTISFVKNSFNGSIPELSKIGFLKAIYLSENKFSGEIPKHYFHEMRSLKKLWLDGNEFTGQIPPSLSKMPQLMELHLENNKFNGTIPDLDSPALVDFNVSNNKLEGRVPTTVLRFNESSFDGNSGLCGEKFGIKCDENRKMEAPSPISAEMNGDTIIIHNGNAPQTDEGKINAAAIAGIISSCIVVILLFIILVSRSRRKKGKEDFDAIIVKQNNEEAVEVQITAPMKREVSAEPIRKSTSNKKGGSGHHNVKGVGELVMINEEKGIFGLPDLMKAAAEMLGNGAFGSSYKAVMANGVAVVVKRTRDMNALEKDGFDAEMKKIANLKHWNILTPLAYHYRKDEKLVISEYVPRGSLQFLLHGDRGSSHSELDWPSRLKIVKGIAEGMRYLHTELASSDLPHGNLKSSNILLGPNYEPLLVDYGFSHMINPASAAQELFAYKAPEAASQGQVSHSCDVYCLGVVILEILTGKFPSQYLSNGKGGTDIVQWVASAISEGRELELLDPQIATSRNNSQGEMKKLLHIGAACTENNPHQRLDMAEAVRRIEEINNEGGKGSRTIEVLPSLRDGYADSHHVLGAQEHGNDQSSRREGSNSFGSKDNFDFGIS